MKTILVTGCAGFLGSNLAEKLLEQNHLVLGCDNFLTGQSKNIDYLSKYKNFEFYERDILDFKVDKKLDVIFNFACPASPPKYQKYWAETINCCTSGLINLVEMAVEHASIFVHASTSEIYGDPLEHPQCESYYGNVNTVGPRSCYDEGKRLAETIIYQYCHQFGLNSSIVRIFNTYGPRMDLNDGRVITNFIRSYMLGAPVTIYGDGTQTRSLCYVDDLINGVISLSEAKKKNHLSIYNIGNAHERTILDVLGVFQSLLNTQLLVEHLPLPQNDPLIRRPDISRIKSEIGWEPQVDLEAGLLKTIEYFLNENGNDPKYNM